MSVVVLSEGKHDVELLTALHRASTDEKNYDTFVAPEANTDQDTRIRQHDVDEAIRWLYKAEGGRSMVLKKFRSNAIRFREFDLVVIVDLDDDSYGEFETQFNATLDEHYNGSLRVESVDHERNPHVQIHECGVFVEGTERYRFDLIAFHDCLEAVTGVYDGEQRHHYRAKIVRYVDHCESVCEDLREVVLAE
jgi:hypothetical protein